MRRPNFSIAPLALALCVSGCGSSGTAVGILPGNGATTRAATPNEYRVKHVVIVIQENRSVDNLFNGLPNADTVLTGHDSQGEVVHLQPIGLAAPYDISHRHTAWEIEYNRGHLNGFNLAPSHCKFPTKCPARVRRAYAYVPRAETKPYFAMAEQYGFADRMFETNQGPSFPAHQYLLSGTSTIDISSPLRAAENPLTADQRWTGGCDSPPGSYVNVIDFAGNEQHTVFPCFERTTMIDLLQQRGLSWRYFGTHHGAGLWNAPDAILHIRKSPQFRWDDATPPSTFLGDLKKGNLANVSWITPTAKASDHAGQTDGSGPSWVASVVNAVGESPFWDSTVVFVIWDDWGGWYDHVQPPLYNSYELGFRVPFIAISAYANKGYVSHRRHEFGSILKFIETDFHLGSLGATDVRADDLSDFFNYQRPPRKFVPIAAPFGESYFLKQKPSSEEPDDDF